jgi:SAM-dependent methyltransferase
MPKLKKNESDASEMILRDYRVSEFRGAFPSVETDQRVDLAALTTGDESPFFVTLPIARVGETSANGLLYDEELVKAIEAQLVGKGGIMGHIEEEKRATEFPVEDVDWVGIARVGDTTWGKAYIPPGAVREYVRRLKARGGRLATSIYGPYDKREALGDGTYRLAGLRLEQLDLAPADRAALKLGGQFGITAQMEIADLENPDKSDNHQEDDEMEKSQVIAELTASEIPQTLRDQIIQEFKEKDDAEKRVTELEKERDAFKKKAEDAQKLVDEKLAHEFDASLDAKVAELTKEWKVEGDEAKKKVDAFKLSLRDKIVSELGDGRTAEKLDAAATAAWEALKPIAETVRDALAGPPARISGKPAHKIEDTPEARRAARQRVGF